LRTIIAPPIQQIFGFHFIRILAFTLADFWLAADFGGSRFWWAADFGGQQILVGGRI
jgi:hypothetical protein